MIETRLAVIARDAEDKFDENQRFSQYLKSLDPVTVDRKVQEHNARVEPEVDCTRCGNCCKSLMINVETEEAEVLAAHLELSRPEFDKKYLEKSDHSERMLINAIPCHFLTDDKCTVYAHRFHGCREFPALDLPHFTRRLFTVFMHYGRCPIIYNVVEGLKADLQAG